MKLYCSLPTEKKGYIEFHALGVWLKRYRIRVGRGRLKFDSAWNEEQNKYSYLPHKERERERELFISSLLQPHMYGTTLDLSIVP